MQLVYTSRPKFDARGIEGQRILREIAENTRQADENTDVSGVLLVGDDWLAQILEGEAEELNPVFKRILADDRHESLRLVAMRKTAERQFQQDCPIIRPDAALNMPFDRLHNLSADDFIRIAGKARAA